MLQNRKTVGMQVHIFRFLQLDLQRTLGVRL
nr:MAG TPA: hypothetical protein [Crassvirales sp.]DAO31330.1 MAG TPA: hypothetical protein [Crassvirales sp.]